MNNTQLHSCTEVCKDLNTVNSHKNVFKNGFNSEHSSICSLSYSYKHYGILRIMVHYYGTNINGTLWYIKHYGSCPTAPPTKPTMPLSVWHCWLGGWCCRTWIQGSVRIPMLCLLVFGVHGFGIGSFNESFTIIPPIKK